MRWKGSDIERSSKSEDDEERMRSEEQSRDRLVTKCLNEVQIHDHPLPDEGFKTSSRVCLRATTKYR